MRQLSALQTTVLHLLVTGRAASTSPMQVLAAIEAFLVQRAGLSDEDTAFHLQKLIDRSLIEWQQLPENLRILLGY